MGFFGNIQRKFRLMAGSNMVRSINKKISKGTIKSIDISAFIEYINNLKEKFDESDIKEIILWCEDFEKIFYFGTEWNQNNSLKNTSIFINKILVSAKFLVQNPEQGTNILLLYKGELSENLEKLAESLTSIIPKIKKAEFQRKKAESISKGLSKS